MEILEDSLVAFRLPAYNPKLRVRERKHPKLYWVDPGLARAAAGRFRELDPRERGPLLEGWIAIETKASRPGPRSPPVRAPCRRPASWPARRILTYTGPRRMRTPGGIDIWPLPDLLEALHSGRLW